MDRTSRLLLATAALLLVGTFVLPLWQIELEAPQYPEGLGMNIFLHTVEGASPNDLESINNLNHYIGMKRIEPDSIAELAYMPFIMAGMIVLGLGAAAWGRRWTALAWVLLFAVLGVAGMIDFYIWEYNYGHDLDPRAIIKIPGMSYQPPLIGSEQILNFMAHSYPGIGAMIAAVSGMLAAWAWWRSRPRPPRAGKLQRLDNDLGRNVSPN
ncbi:MAG: hypothetical protein RBU27_03665 [Bacteroidota bacterium]|jgi:hypothetical protein|nr:hypothetical protein [Bacteroidota bacterium]